MSRRRIQFSVLATSIIAMVLQLLVASAHIHGLDGDTYHHGLSRSEGKVHANRHDAHRDVNQVFDHHADSHVHQDAHIDHKHHSHSDNDQEPAQACDFCWLFGALSSLDTPNTTALAKPTLDKTVRLPLATERLHRHVLKRAHRTRAPPSIT